MINCSDNNMLDSIVNKSFDPALKKLRHYDTALKKLQGRLMTSSELAQMHHGQNMGGKKRKSRKKRKLNGKRGKFRNFNEIGKEVFEFCGNRGMYAKCIID